MPAEWLGYSDSASTDSVRLFRRLDTDVTEREAWLAAAEIAASDPRLFGMCFHIQDLWSRSLIDTVTHQSMMSRIRREMRARGIALNGFLYPIGKAGAKKRAAFCRKQARELEKKGGAK